MGNWGRRIVYVVLVMCVCLAVGVSAQKVKAPTYVWSVTVDPNSINLEGPTTENGTPIPFVNDGVAIHVSGGGPCATCPASNFQLAIVASTDLDELPWLGFKDLPVPAGGTMGPCRYPEFDVQGAAIPNSSVVQTPGCVIDFMNHRHPQLPYRNTSFWIALSGVDIMTMPWPSARMRVMGNLRPQITGPDCTTAGNYSRVAFSSSSSDTMYVTRLTEHDWKVDLVDHPIAVNEWLSKRSTTKRGAPTCVSEMLYPAATTKVTASLTWRRTVVR